MPADDSRSMLSAAPHSAKADRNQQCDPGARRGIAGQKQRHQRRACRLAQQPRGSQHAARAAAALARRRRDHGAVVGGLEQTEADAGKRHAPDHVERRGRLGHQRQCAEAACKQHEADAAEQAGRIAFDQPSGERGCECDGDRPGRDQKSDLDRRIAEPALEIKRHRDEGQHLGAERGDRGARSTARKSGMRSRSTGSNGEG